MTNFLWAICASIVVSLISLIGIFGLLLKENLLNRILILLIGFSAGSLIGGAFLHLFPEALEQSKNIDIFLYVIFGFIFFFILEKYFYWRHCHNGICDTHTFTYLNLIGDGIHNFTDGLAIGTSFVVNIQFGVITSLAIIFHEIPQEIGDFAILIYGGFKKIKALLFNFISAFSCIVGTILGFYLSEKFGNFSPYLLSVTTGGFIYIAACDLIPELHKQPDIKRDILSIISFLSGIFFILLSKSIYPH
jgi:zinc and cadmium transporter